MEKTNYSKHIQSRLDISKAWLVSGISARTLPYNVVLLVKTIINVIVGYATEVIPVTSNCFG